MRVRHHSIPSLDGLRAVAIACVLICHLNNYAMGHGHTGWLNRLVIAPFGSFGVQIFFVLSGFIITNLLLHEWDRSRSINLPRFYFRRALRIFPAYYTFLCVMLLASAAGIHALAARDFLFAGFYVSDYALTPHLDLGHSWSLAVEEQFYLLWPATLVLLGPKRARWAAFGVVLLAPAIRLGVYHFAHLTDVVSLSYQFTSRMDALAMGCLLAMLRPWLQMRSAYRAFLLSPLFPIIPGLTCILPLGLTMLHGRFLEMYVFAGFSVMSLGIALAMDWLMTDTKTLPARLLNTAPFAAVGLLSYSIYLWQEPFLNWTNASWYTAPPVSCALIALTACASYYLVERPTLNLRKRLEPLVYNTQRRVPHPSLEEPAPGTA